MSVSRIKNFGSCFSRLYEINFKNYEKNKDFKIENQQNQTFFENKIICDISTLKDEREKFPFKINKFCLFIKIIIGIVKDKFLEIVSFLIYVASIIALKKHLSRVYHPKIDKKSKTL